MYREIVRRITKTKNTLCFRNLCLKKDKICLARTFHRSDKMAMAYRCSGDSNEEMVKKLEENAFFFGYKTRHALLDVDRKNYCPNKPYQDSPQPIGFAATISAPHMHAIALEYLRPSLIRGAKVLDVGSGSGYLAAVMAMMVGRPGKVIGIDHIPELVELATNNVKKGNADLLETGRVKFVVGDGREGYPPEAPYDAIHVGAAAPSIPQALIDQLKPDGRMIIPVGPEDDDQMLNVVYKNHDGTYKTSELYQVFYIPLTDKDHQIYREHH